MKTCRECGRTKPLSEFYARKDSPDGYRNDCKECLKARTERSRQADPEGAARRSRQWAINNPEEARAIKRKHYEANRRKIINRARQWVIDNQERHRATWKAWYDTNPLSRHAAAAKRRAAKASAETRIITTKDIRHLLARYRGCCIYCGATATQLDHVIPLARGGRHAIGNLVPACKPCNTSKKDKLLVAWRHLTSSALSADATPPSGDPEGRCSPGLPS